MVEHFRHDRDLALFAVRQTTIGAMYDGMQTNTHAHMVGEDAGDMKRNE